MKKRSDLDFKSFKKNLEAQKEKILKSIDAIGNDVNVLSFESDLDDIVDVAEHQMESESAQRILAHFKIELSEIEDALMRIQNGTYGICEKTGKNIPIERLEANPIARAVI